MTFQEILNLYDDDVPFVNHKINDAAKYFNKKATSIRNTDRVFYNPIKVTTKHGFNVVIQFFNRGINYTRKNRIGVYLYVKYLQDDGLHAFSPSLMDKRFVHVTHILPHFFDRYRERKLKDLSINKDTVIDLYFKNNLKRAITGVPSDKYPNNFWSYTDEGLALCTKENLKFTEFKTFLPWEDLGPVKAEIAQKGIEHIKASNIEIHIPDNYNI